MMLAMMEHQDKETQLPTLKANHIKFMKVLIDYVICVFGYILILLYGQPEGLTANAINSLPSHQYIKSVVSRISYVATGTSLVYLIMMLQAYIFNIYAIVMNMLRCEYHKNNQ